MDKQENMNREPGGIRGLCWGSIFQFFTLIKLKFIRRAYEACKWSSVLQEQEGGKGGSKLCPCLCNTGRAGRAARATSQSVS